MSKLYLGAFVVIAGVAVGAVDYINQAKVAGSKPGQFQLGDYAHTISDRFISQRATMNAAAARREMLAQAPRDHLPDAPEGWIRRDMTKADLALLENRYDLEADDTVPEEFKNDPTLGALMKASDGMKARADAREVYVYQQGDQIISLRLAQVSTAKPGGLGGLGMQMVEASLQGMKASEGFAMAGGVAYRLEQGMFGQDAASQADGSGTRVISGKIGDELKVTIRARAGDDAILTFLKALDYDRLNAMLEVPADGVGNDAPELDLATSKAMADAKMRQEDHALRQEGQAAEAQLMALADKINADKTGLTALGAALGAVPPLDDRKPGGADAEFVRSLATSGLDAAGSESAAPSGLFGSITGALGGMFGAGGTPAMRAEPVAAPEAPKSSGFGFSASSCKTTNGIKRCTIGGN